jgi:hypothetical protein
MQANYFKVTILWDVTQCSAADRHEGIRGTYSLHTQDKKAMLYFSVIR